MKKIILVSCLLFISISVSYSQSAYDPIAIISKINKKFKLIKDYQADAVIDARISFLKILPQKAIIYFKQPDKFHLQSKGIAILPKQNFENLYSLLADEKSYQAFASGNEIINSKPTIILNVIPNQDTSDLVLAKIWVDISNELILKAQLTTKTNGTILIEYSYSKNSDVGLPDQIIFTVDVKKFKIPKAVSADINSTASPSSNSSKEPKKGRIIVKLVNYIINKGISDTVFK